jgi:hypothetical protein
LGGLNHEKTSSGSYDLKRDLGDLDARKRTYLRVGKTGFFEVVFGFLGCMGLIFLSEFLGKFFLSRRRDYYGDF